jgi:ribose-phosphate pyrophosphokinase
LYEAIKAENFSVQDTVVLAPDIGSVKMSQSYAKTLGMHFALIDKRRFAPNQAEVNHLIGELEDMDVLIIDDMIDTAGTTVNAANAAIAEGAKSVTAVATHGVLSGPAIERLSGSSIKKVIITDTISISEDKKIDKLKIVSVSKIFGEAVIRVHNGESVSALFEF